MAYRKGNIPWIKGKQHTAEAKREMGAKHLGLPSCRKGKKYEEIFGVERATEIKKRMRKPGKHCGKKNPMYGKIHSVESKEKNRNSHLGRYNGDKNPMWGKSPTTKGKTYEESYGLDKAKELRGIRSKSAQKMWKNTELAMSILRKARLEPNKLETKMDSLLQDNFPNEWKFVGDGKVFINGLCPDFINDEKKKIIEVFGKYWHSGKLAQIGVPEHRTEDGKKKAFSEMGYDTLVIWDDEFKDEKKIIEKIKNFINVHTLI